MFSRAHTQRWGQIRRLLFCHTNHLWYGRSAQAMCSFSVCAVKVLMFYILQLYFRRKSNHQSCFLASWFRTMVSSRALMLKLCFSTMDNSSVLHVYIYLFQDVCSALVFLHQRGKDLRERGLSKPISFMFF